MEPFLKIRLIAVMVIGTFLCCNAHSTNAKLLGIDEGLCDEATSESDCIWYIMEDIRIKLHQGAPFKDLPPLDPFHIPIIHIETSDGSTTTVDGDFWNDTLTGLTGYVSKTITFNSSAETSCIQLMFPTMQLDGVYSLNGSFLHMIPVTGNGGFIFRLDDVNIGMDLHVITINDKPAIDKLTATITIRDVFIDLQNIGGPFQYLINTVLNIAAELLKLKINPKLGQITQDYFRAILNEYLAIVNI